MLKRGEGNGTSDRLRLCRFAKKAEQAGEGGSGIGPQILVAQQKATRMTIEKSREPIVEGEEGGQAYSWMAEETLERKLSGILPETEALPFGAARAEAKVTVKGEKGIARIAHEEEHWPAPCETRTEEPAQRGRFVQYMGVEEAGDVARKPVPTRGAGQLV